MMGDFSFKHKDMMKLLLFLDTLRGEDSTGLSAIRSDGSIETFKLTVPGYDFARMPRTESMMRLNDDVWMGHNRAKTVGALSRLNAHPFEVCDNAGDVVLVGAHNGTLHNKSDIPGHSDFGTDSEALLNHIANVGAKEAISKVRGAWSLVWFDFYEDTLNFLRNKDRPMSYVLTEDEKVLIWASEEWMIKAAANRFDVKLKEFLYPKEDYWIRFKLPERKGDRRIKEATFEGGVEGAAPPKSSFQGDNSYHYGYSYRSGNDGWKKPEAAKTGGSEGTSEKKEGEKSVQVPTENKVLMDDDPITLPGDLNKETIRGYKGKPISRDSAATIGLLLGCVWCGDKISMADPFAFVEDDEMVCHNCLRDTHAEEEEEESNVIRLPSALTPLQKETLLRKKEGRK